MEDFRSIKAWKWLDESRNKRLQCRFETAPVIQFNGSKGHFESGTLALDAPRAHAYAAVSDK
jgi:hypothetical protein